MATNLLWIILLIGFLFLLYKYQDKIFNKFQSINNNQKSLPKLINQRNEKKITPDNISQISASSLDFYNEKSHAYKPSEQIDSEVNIRSLLEESLGSKNSLFSD